MISRMSRSYRFLLEERFRPIMRVLPFESLAKKGD